MVIVPIVVGPTGVGKTEIVLPMAEEMGAEIISADSRQIYRYMDIGTAKPTLEQRRRVPHHLVDCIDPKEEFNAAQYGRMAGEIISQLLAAGKRPLVVGGGGLYLRALLEGFFQGPGADPEIRRRLVEQESHQGPGSLYRYLIERDPRSARRIHPHDQMRTIRALEVLELTGIPLSRWQEQGPYCQPQFSWCKLGLYLERERLYSRIEERIDGMLAKGLLEEVQALLSKGYSPDLRALDSIGYREMLVHIRGHVGFERAVSQLKRNTRQYAKRQMTWFCKESDIFWFHAGNEQKQFLFAIRKLWGGQFPEEKELKKRRKLLRRSWEL